MFIALLALAGHAGAQVYKCTNAAGKVEYSDAPCGTAIRDGRVIAAPPTEDERLRRENETLRRQLVEQENRALRDRLNAQEGAAYRSPMGEDGRGRTSADLQAEKANTFECRKAKREYEVVLDSLSSRSKVPAARLAMYSACGMAPPTHETTVIRGGPSTCVRTTGRTLVCN